MNIIRTLTAVSFVDKDYLFTGICRIYSASASNNATYSCKLLVVGGGSGGCTMAAKFARRLPKDSVIVLEPSKNHYYQPLWTLVGAGIFKVNDTLRSEVSVLPTNAKWIRDSADKLKPEQNKVITAEGHEINYEYLIIAVGIENDYGKIPGLTQAMNDKSSPVSSIFDSKFCEKTFENLKQTKKGNVIFTCPNTPVKCPGAPQKIAYLADSFLDKENIMAYSMLHVTPPMCTPAFLRNSKCLVDSCGFLEVDKYTLQNQKYANVYGIGDCINTPNSKTGASIAQQSWVLEHNLLSTMRKDAPKEMYDGYGACPVVTSYNTAILAEFVYGGIPRETMPFNQACESRIAFYMKKYLFPFIYWHFMLKGYYHGPESVRKLLNPFSRLK